MIILNTYTPIVPTNGFASSIPNNNPIVVVTRSNAITKAKIKAYLLQGLPIISIISLPL